MTLCQGAVSLGSIILAFDINQAEIIVRILITKHLFGRRGRRQKGSTLVTLFYRLWRHGAIASLGGSRIRLIIVDII